MALDWQQNLFLLNILRTNGHNFAKVCKCVKFIRSMLGLLSSIFCSFATELLPMIDVRILFLLNIFRTWPFYSIKKRCSGAIVRFSDNSSYSGTVVFKTYAYFMNLFAIIILEKFNFSNRFPKAFNQQYEFMQ